MRHLRKKDETRENLNKLIDLYAEYRQMEYDLFKQYNLLLEDPKFDTLYISVDPLIHYRGYLENDLDGTPEHSSTTDIIKEFKKLRDLYDSTLESRKNNINESIS